MRISSSVTNGPPRKPLPGSTTLASPMKPRVRMRNGGKLRQERRAAPTPPSPRVRRVAPRTSSGATSANVNTTMISMTMPAAHPTVPKLGSSTVPSNVAEIIWHASSTSRTLFRRLLRMLEQAQHALGALVALVGEVQQADPARAHERGLRQREHCREREQRRRSPRWRRHDRSHGPQDLCSSSRKRQELLLAPTHHDASLGSAWS